MWRRLISWAFLQLQKNTVTVSCYKVKGYQDLFQLDTKPSLFLPLSSLHFICSAFSFTGARALAEGNLRIPFTHCARRSPSVVSIWQSFRACRIPKRRCVAIGPVRCKGLGRTSEAVNICWVVWIWRKLQRPFVIVCSFPDKHMWIWSVVTTLIVPQLLYHLILKGTVK